MSAHFSAPAPFLQVVICTYNRAALLDRTLQSLASQRAAPCAWGVLVVNNNSIDETELVVRRWIQSAAIPGLRSIGEPLQGLTPARLAGSRNTNAEWIAFVDDDCLLEPEWIAAACEFAGRANLCGVFGGRVVLAWEHEPYPYLRQIGWAFAEQDMGAGAMQVENLVGAGMVVRRSALVASGWMERQILPDRVGKSVISGGDVEITQRIRSAGFELWYEPRCELRHSIPAARLSLRYALRLTRALGVSQALCAAAMLPGSSAGWAGATGPIARSELRAALRQIRYSLSNGVRELSVRVSFAWGLAAGMLQLIRMRRKDRQMLLGAAAVTQPGPRPAAEPSLAMSETAEKEVPRARQHFLSHRSIGQQAADGNCSDHR